VGTLRPVDAEQQDQPFVLLGSAARRWPEPGCGCMLCTAGPASQGSATVGLAVAGLRLDAAGTHPVLPAGQTRTAGAVRLLALPRSGDGVALVVGVKGRTLLWAPGGGSLDAEVLDAVEGAELDGAVLDLRGPDGEPDPVALAHDVARLRRARALAPGADLVAVGLTHAAGDLTRLAARIRAWGVRLAEPGTVVGLRPPPGGTAPAASRRTLVLGPAASGKSGLAEDLLAAEPDVVYLAPGSAPGPDDADWAARVAMHQQRRPPWWSTVEGGDVPALLARPGPPVLLDSLGTWVTHALERTGAWDDVPGWSDRYGTEVDSMVRAWRTGARRVVAVAEETGWGVVPSSGSGRRFRDALGRLTQRLADDSERVLLVVAGRAVDLDQLRVMDGRGAIDRLGAMKGLEQC